MKEIFSIIINFLAENYLTLIIFILGSFYTFYLNFKGLYRLVYSTERICKRSNKYIDWSNENNIFFTRILFYNNGKKTLTKDEIKKLQINSSNEILNIRNLKQNTVLNSNLDSNKIDVEFIHLDPNDFIALEIEHKGNLEVDGRISESGKIINTETKTWLTLNIVFMVILLSLLIYNIIKLATPDDIKSIVMLCLNVLIFFIGVIFIRYLHQLFFIPDKVSRQYLGVEDKWNRKFYNNF